MGDGCVPGTGCEAVASCQVTPHELLLHPWFFTLFFYRLLVVASDIHIEATITDDANIHLTTTVYAGVRGPHAREL